MLYNPLLAMECMRTVSEFFTASRTTPKYSPIAQLVERRTVNPQVPGSSPGRGANKDAILQAFTPSNFALQLSSSSIKIRWLTQIFAEQRQST